jgi:hypothetical protein
MRGRGPEKGAANAGRPPNAWREACRELASRDEMLARACEILKNPDHPAWLTVWKFVAEQGFGKAPQAAEMAAEEELKPIQVIVIGDQRIEIG